MNQPEIEMLATATAQWLTDKRNEKLGGVLSESLLILPAAKHLISLGWSDVKSECHSEELFGIGATADVNYDLCACKDGTLKLLIEMKMLKKVAADQRLFKDFVKLAIPPYSVDCTRLVPIKSNLINEIVKSGKCIFHMKHESDFNITRGNETIILSIDQRKLADTMIRYEKRNMFLCRGNLRLNAPQIKR
jgi:hypothetical protein